MHTAITVYVHVWHFKLPTACVNDEYTIAKFTAYSQLDRQKLSISIPNDMKGWWPSHLVMYIMYMSVQMICHSNISVRIAMQ